MPIQYQIPHLPMLGKGSVFFDRFDANGAPQGYLHLGNCTKFELQLKDEKADLYQHINATPSLIATALKKRDVMLAITGTDFNSDHMALALMSSGKTSLTGSAASVAAEAFMSVAVAAQAAGKYFQTANKNIDPTAANVSVQNTAGSPVTYVAGTDYVLLDAVQGIFYIPVGSSIPASTFTITVSYHTLVATNAQVAGAVIPFALGKLRFTPDPTDGQKIGVEVWRVHMSPNGQIGLIADDYGNWTLDALALDDTSNHPNSPYFLATFY